MKVLRETQFTGLRPAVRGKVRDVYDLDDKLLIVATDRLSAFDVILPTPIPDKGRVLTQLSLFWFDLLKDAVPNHVLSATDFPARFNQFKDYRNMGKICGITLPTGLRESDRLPEPIFTPATKAATGHDENIPFEQAAALIGKELAEKVRAVSLEIYRRAAAYAEPRGVILADTKFEFGLLNNGLIWIDEALTPDSSRFWPAAQYNPGGPQPSFDKQFVRDYLERIHWPKTPPGPELPVEVVDRTRAKYREAFRILVGRELD